MEKNIVKNGTKVILFALGTEDTNVTGYWSTMSGVLMYECHYKELDGTEGDLDNLQRRNFEIIPNKFINLTPHTITLNNGTEYHPSGKVARVENQFSNFCCGISTVFYGEIENLPEPEEGTIYIVSAMVLAADSESAVVYGNTTKNTVIEYLSNLTPKNGEEAISIIMQSNSW